MAGVVQLKSKMFWHGSYNIEQPELRRHVGFSRWEHPEAAYEIAQRMMYLEIQCLETAHFQRWTQRHI